MAITIRNKATEATVRELTAETGEGPSALIGRLVAEEKERLSEVERLERARRQHVLRELIAMLPKLTEEEKAEMDKVHEGMYDERGVPR